MDLFGYYDLATRTASTGVSTGRQEIPPIIAGEQVQFRVRFRETREGVTLEKTPEIRSMRAALGYVDAAPTEGAFKLVLGAETTTSITYTSTLATLATSIKSALEALTAVPANDVTAVVRDGSIILTFATNPTVVREFTVTSNTLFPSSFVRARTYSRGGRVEHELRFVQAPVAFSSTFSLENGEIPTITELRDGATVDDVEWSEIQKLYVPANFKGTYRIVKDGTKRTDPLSQSSTIEDIAAALVPLAEPGGLFEVTNPVDYTAYIEFSGDMTGEDFPLLTIEVFDGPTPDTVVTLDTNTREMADALLGSNEVTLILEVRAEVQDPNDEDVYHWHVLLKKEIKVQESVDWDGLGVAPNIDWLRPPTHWSFNPFSPGQVANGQIHYATTLGDGAATTFVVDHSLDTTLVDVALYANDIPGDRYVAGEHYTWTRDSADAVTVTWLGSAPAAAALQVVVLGLAQTSFFDAHEHSTTEITGLSDWMALIEGRLSVLESVTGGSTGLEIVLEPEEVARWTLPKFFEAWPGKHALTLPEDGLGTIRDELLDENGKSLLGRSGGLLPAIHDASVTAHASGSLPVASSTAGSVFQNTTGGDLSIPGGKRHRAMTIKDDEYFASDGRILYPVVRYGVHADTVAVAGASNVMTYSSAAEYEMFEDGTVVRFVTSAPSGLSTSTDYVITMSDYTARTFKLTLVDGTAVTFANDAANYTFRKTVEDSFYPKAFERKLFEVFVNANQFRARKVFELAFELQLALLNANEVAQWVVALQIGNPRAVATGGGIVRGTNIREMDWSETPFLEQRIILTDTPTTHKFAARITRNTIEGGDVIKAFRYHYGALTGEATPPLTADFAIRAVLTRFDAGDIEEDQKGVVIVNGLVIDKEQETANGAFEYGFAKII